VNFDEVRPAVTGRWRAILPTLGVPAGALVNKHGPCPGCGGKDRFRFDDEGGRGTWICSQGGGETIAGDGFELLVHAGRARTIQEALEIVGTHLGLAKNNVVRLKERTKIDTQEYEYRMPDGELVLIVTREDFDDGSKDFKQKLPDGRAPKEVPDRKRAVYRLERWHHTNDTIYVCEGEKCVHAAEALGLVATTNDGGKNNWQDHHAAWLAGKHVVVLPDNDEGGEHHARSVINSCLAAGAASVRRVDLPRLGHRGDIADWDGDLEELEGLRAAAQPERLATRLRWVTLAELVERPPVPWLLPGYVPARSLAAVYGPSASFKSFWMLDMSLRLAHGLPIYGEPVDQAAVVYIAAEGAAGMQKRVAAWHQHFGYPVSQARLRVVEQPVDLLTAEVVDQLIADIKDVHGGGPVGAVVVDTLARCLGGNENAPEVMNAGIEALDRIKTECACAVILVHHTGKDSSRGLRGHSSLIGALDASIQVQRHGERLELLSDKQKDELEAESRWLNTRRIEIDGSAFDEVQTSLVLEESEQPVSRKPRLSPQEQFVQDVAIKMLAKQGVTHADTAGYWSGVSIDKADLKAEIAAAGGEINPSNLRRVIRDLTTKDAIGQREGRVWVWGSEKIGADDVEF
tara:strand:- start:1816 stop:3705 length:1890 start_codon:yes stop_codon:yes gene_type:complete